MIAYEVTVDPEQLLVVSTEGGDFIAVTCRYVPVLADGGRRIAMEVAFDPNVTRPLTAYRCPADRLERVLLNPQEVTRIRPYGGSVAPESKPGSVENKVALAYVEALAEVARANGVELSSYAEGARQNIEQGDRASVEPNLEVICNEVHRSVPGVWANIDNVDRLRNAMRARMPNASPREIAIAARLLAWCPGGDAATHAAMWHTPLPAA